MGINDINIGSWVQLPSGHDVIVVGKCTDYKTVVDGNIKYFGDIVFYNEEVYFSGYEFGVVTRFEPVANCEIKKCKCDVKDLWAVGCKCGGS